MRANFTQGVTQDTLKTIYCAFFLAFFIAGAICGFAMAHACDANLLLKYCVAVCLNDPGFLWLLFPLVRFLSLVVLCGRFQIGVLFMPLLFFLRGLSAVFYFSAFCVSLPESVTVGSAFAYLIYLFVTLSVLIGFGWSSVRILYVRKFGRTSYGKHHHEI